MNDQDRRIVAALLKLAADQFSNHGCNDFDAKAELGLSDAECKALWVRLAEWSGDPELAKREGHFFFDWMLMRFFAEVVEKGEGTPEEPPEPPPSRPQHIRFAGHSVVVDCDRKCHKAWGISARPRNGKELMLKDDELGTAPEDPGSYEGPDGKPSNAHTGRLNKWCIRECERSVMADTPEELTEDLRRRLADLGAT